MGEHVMGTDRFVLERMVPLCGVRFGRSGLVVFTECRLVEPPPRLGEELLVELAGTLRRGRVIVAPDQVVFSELDMPAARAVRRLA
jgi:hypothetical protein